MLFDPPPSHRTSRFLMALLLTAAFLAIVAALAVADVNGSLLETGKRYIEEVRVAWRS